MFPRIPQASRYLEVLDVAVRQVIAGELEAQAGLDAVALQWDDITDEIGRRKPTKAVTRGDWHLKLDGIQEASAGGRLVIFVVVRTIIPAYSKSIADKVLDYFVKSLRKPFSFS